MTISRTLLSVILLLCLLPVTVPARGQGGGAALFVVTDPEVSARAEPGFIYRETIHLQRGDEVIVDGEQEGWFRIAGGRGWIPKKSVTPKALLQPRRTCRVITDNARVRSEPSTSAAVVDTLRKGEEAEVAEEKDGWYRIPDHGWIKGTLVEILGETRAARPAAGASPARPDPARPPAEAAGARPPSPASMPDPREWGWLSLTGVYLRVIELPPAHPTLQQIERELSGVLGDPMKFTYMLLVVDVPPNCAYSFNYEPESNRVVVVTKDGREWANFVHTSGRLTTLSTTVRRLFEPMTVLPGAVEQGILLFRRDLDPREIRKVMVMVNGKSQELLEIE